MNDDNFVGLSEGVRKGEGEANARRSTKNGEGLREAGREGIKRNSSEKREGKRRGNAGMSSEHHDRK